MSINKSVITTMLAMIFVCSCAQRSDKCMYFSSEYKRTNIVTSKLVEVSLGLPEIKKALLAVRECYPNHQYMGFDNKPKVRNALKSRNNTYLIIAELYGVSDLILIFETDRNGNIIGFYQGSTL